MIKKQKATKYFITSGLFYLYCLIFSLFSLVFLSDSIPKAVTVIFGFVFMAPIAIVIFFSGKTCGEKDFKETAAEQSDKNSNVFTAVKMKYSNIPLYFVSFAAPLIILLILGIALNNAIIHGIVFFLLMPVSLIFNTLGVITVDPITWLSFAVYLPSILLLCGFFVLGYLLRVFKLVNQRRDIASELRMFNN